MTEFRVDPYLGRWILDLDESEFDQGEAPAGGTYEITREGDILSFRVGWTDAEGRVEAVSFAGRADGRSMPLRQSGLADGFRHFLDDEGALVTEASKDGVVLMTARRSLIEGQSMMMIEQTVNVPGTGPVSNSAVYRRAG